MTIKLELPPEVETRLAEQAASAGVDVSTYVTHVVRDMFATELSESDNDDQSVVLNGDKSREAFHAWVASQQSHNPHFDDSRESIYD